jgi:hypothetical protein
MTILLALNYLVSCRNWILSLWSKDVSRILPLADCGVSDTPFEDEPPRATLIREIYAFLDHSVSLFRKLIEFLYVFFLIKMMSLFFSFAFSFSVICVPFFKGLSKSFFIVCLVFTCNAYNIFTGLYKCWNCF